MAESNEPDAQQTMDAAGKTVVTFKLEYEPSSKDRQENFHELLNASSRKRVQAIESTFSGPNAKCTYLSSTNYRGCIPLLSALSSVIDFFRRKMFLLITMKAFYCSAYSMKHASYQSVRNIHNNLSQQLNLKRDLNNFDFASRDGWDEFYLSGSITDKDSHFTDNGNDRVSSERETSRRGDYALKNEMNPANENNFFEFEWHSSISNDFIISEMSRLLDFSRINKNRVNSESRLKCLMLGCGNSALPRQLYESHGGLTHVTCFDYSLPCIEMQQNMHSSECPNMSFIHGDATSLVECLAKHNNLSSEAQYDVIVDKGLIDALMCGEGWDADVKRLLSGASDVLHKPGGLYILVSYKLASHTKEFIQNSEACSLEWNFDLPHESSSVVSFSTARNKESE